MVGFTLTEVLVASAILTVVIAMIYAILISGNDLWEIERCQIDLQGQGRIALNLMVTELRKTTRTASQNPSPNLNIPSTPNNKDISFYFPADLDNNGLITDTSGSIEWDTNNKIQYHYIPGQKQLVRLEKEDQTIIAQHVTDIQFIDNSIDSTLFLNEVKIVMSMYATTPHQRTLVMTFTAMVKLRN